MANDLKILITGALDPNKSVTEINKGLEQLQGKIEKLNVSINIDDTVLKTLKDFASQMENVAEIAKNTGKVIETALMPDGSKITRTYFSGIKGEFAETVQAAKDSAKQQLVALEEVAGGWGKATKEVERYNAAQAKTGGTNTYKQGYQTLNVKTNADDQVLSYNETTNYAKQAQDTQKLINEQDKLTQSLKRLYDQGVLNEQFFTNFNKAINSSKNVEEIDKLTSALQRVSQYSKNQNLQQNLLGQSQSLLNSGKVVDAEGINGLITNLNNINLSGSNATRQLSLMQNQLREYQSSATNATESTNTLGSSFKSVFSNLSMYFGGFALMQASFQTIKDGIGYINDLNKALTEISIVTYQNQQQVAALGDSYNKLAQQMGVTTTDIANEAAELYRQGLSADQVTSRMKTITEYAKISSMDTKTATEIMTAAINSMGVSAQRASDVWALLGDATATGKHMCPLLQ